MEGNVLASYGMLTEGSNSLRVEGRIITTKWNNRMIPAREGLGLVHLVADICKKTKHLSSGEVTIYNDNKLLFKGANNNIKKASVCALKTGTMIAKLKKWETQASVDVIFEYSNDKMNTELDFEELPSRF